MSTTEVAPRSRSAFAAAFLSMVFPGLGHAYARAYGRALAFAALPFLVLALAAGVALRTDRDQLIAFVVQQQVLVGLLVLNVIAFIYRAIAAIDAWQVARFLNAADLSGGGRLGRAKLALSPLSVAGLLAVVLVMAGGHVAVAHYNSLALDLVSCLNPDTTDPSCEASAATPSPGDSTAPSDSGLADLSPSPSSDIPTPIGSDTGATPAPTLPPWNGTDRLNILMVGNDQRGTGSFNTDTMIVVSVDPKTNQVAMLQLPRDTVNVPVPANARALWGSTYAGKITSWFTANMNRPNLWPGKTSLARGMAALKAILGELYGLNINYYVMVNFQGFVDAVNTLGGLQVNVQIPVAEDAFPLTDNSKTRVYIPAGPQHMTGVQALVFARSRHGSNDYDRGHRQQRVIVSLKDQANPQAIFANLTNLVTALKQSVRTDVPLGTNVLPQLLALAQRIDTKNIRSYVFAPPFFSTDMWGPSGGTNSNVVINAARVRAAVAQAFTVSPLLLAQRDQLGAEGAQVWVQGSATTQALAANNADYLAYYGLDASAPNSVTKTTPAKTTITVYNGAETSLGATIAYLQQLYGVQVRMVADPTVTVDIIVTLGSDAKTLTIPNVG
jgi:LCP family protein required for cell wall assembly